MKANNDALAEHVTILRDALGACIEANCDCDACLLGREALATTPESIQSEATKREMGLRDELTGAKRGLVFAQLERDNRTAAYEVGLKIIRELRTQLFESKLREAVLQDRLDQGNLVMSCKHTQNFLIGDEHGHFTCTVCASDQLAERVRALVDALKEIVAFGDISVRGHVRIAQKALAAKEQGE